MLHDQLVAELKTREGTRCNCCPYGYHIHLDFVQFCDALKAQAAKGNMDQLRQLCKERRRQRRSLQAYLGTLDQEASKTEDSTITNNKTIPSNKTMVQLLFKLFSYCKHTTGHHNRFNLHTFFRI